MFLVSTFLALLVTGITASSLKVLTSNGIRRSYWVHTPSSYDDSKSYPIVLAFHGSSKLGHDIDGFAMEADTRLTLPVFSTKYSESKIFVYPNGARGTWAGPSYANASVPEDLQFISDLLLNLKENFNVDDSRIYATGLSNGGGFVGILACAPVGSKFSAFAAVAGAFYEKASGIDVGNCAVGRGVVPMLEIHGGSDKTVNYEGGVGEGGIEPSILSWLELWQRRNWCSQTPVVEDLDRGVHHSSWSCGEKKVEGVLQHWKVDGGGHYWPSKTENTGMLVAMAGPQPIEASDIVIDFFDKWVLGKQSLADRRDQELSD
ncbi:hypothetical protein E2P81_ATG01454 [Venturia nashicola]|uniref:feruloyl esterase n=1 Tax=Venturia nashicola TaxID=86259 RepID=A0A4Z1PS79_9PEZI|nr:hypothetical protein E6O75_ATG01488 [Venturia nashicola]TLD38911.1 hypothetical protein E2P81_ATG01454 [Venturia nashicola]